LKTLRPWQAEALPRILENLHERPMVRAVMGSGKSILIAELCRLRPDDAILVTTPTVKLVEQLAETIAEWTGEPVGVYYTHAKAVERITVCCHASLPTFADQTFYCDIWIADEVHKTETEIFKNAIDTIAPLMRIGFTATPYRADKEENITLFDHLIYDYGAQDAIRDKVVVPLVVKHYEGEDTRLDDAAIAVIRDAKGPGLVNAYNITDAENFAEYLALRGIAALSIHSKLPKNEQSARIEQLRTGAIRCLVHVDMLSEGVDLPWLRWLCARRLVKSRVRFAQEVGRILRAAEGKTHATVYDLHDLFGALSLDYEACIGGEAVEDRDEIELAALEIDFELEEIRKERDVNKKNGVPLRIISPTQKFIRQLKMALQMAGLIEIKVKSTHWRNNPPSEPQLDFLRQMEPPTPGGKTRALNVAWHAAPGLTKGDVSDLISILQVLRRYGWPDIEKQSAREDLGGLHPQGKPNALGA
jgi:superfamily II DNA or RNA helicase